MTKVHLFAFAVAAALGVAWGGLATAQVPKGNHYQCYPATQAEQFTPRKGVLIDQFGKHEVTVLGVTRLCNPVEKRVTPGALGPIVDKTLHLVCYRIEGSQPGKAVRVQNQFGRATLKVGAANELCLPSAKAILK